MAELDTTTSEGRRQYARDVLAHESRRMEDYKPIDAVDAACHLASKNAGQWAKDAGLHPYLTEDGKFEYEIQQGLRSAHWAREDSAATLILMRPVLYALRDAKRLLWAVIALLTVVAWRVW